MSTVFDADACGAEPIHIPGAIQPHGALFVLREGHALHVAQASDNLEALLGIARPAQDAPLHELLGSTVAEAVRDALAAGHVDVEARPRLLGRFDIAGKPCDVVVHRCLGVAIVEVEPDPPGALEFWAVYELTRSLIAKLREADSIVAMCRTTAEEVRRLSGFGQTLVYAFDADGHGHVLAEDRDASYPSYLDHRFPAADIPRQARELYRRNHIRLIATADYRPARLQPPLHPDTGGPTDLSFAALRSVSPVHLEYMRNMGTQASMSASIMVRGELWGLISCHDRQARRVPHALRTAFEHLAQVLSLQIEGHHDRSEVEHRARLRAMLMSMLAGLGLAEGGIEGLVERPDELLGFGAAGGAAVVSEGRCRSVGSTPGEDEIFALVGWLARQGRDVFATDRLGELYPPARRWAESAAGVMAVSVSKLHEHFVVWFRPEVVQTLRWAGNPHLVKPVVDGRLHPRSSFASWQEQLQGRSLPWRPSELDGAAEFRNAMLGIVLKKAEEVATLANELERSNAELEAFSYSVSHDLRAPLRHIAGYADLLRDATAQPLSDRAQRFIANIKDSAGFAGRLVDDLLAFSRIGRTSLKPTRVKLDELVASVIGTSALGTTADVQWDVEPLPIVQGDPILLKVAVENLVGNAIKYSAGRTPPRIAIRAVDAGERHGLSVRDNGVGFDMKYVHKLFGVFQRLHSMEEFEGTGIGLANVRRIAERHGGTIEAQGDVDRGATFTFLLPKTPIATT